LIDIVHSRLVIISIRAGPIICHYRIANNGKVPGQLKRDLFRKGDEDVIPTLQGSSIEVQGTGILVGIVEDPAAPQRAIAYCVACCAYSDRFIPTLEFACKQAEQRGATCALGNITSQEIDGAIGLHIGGDRVPEALHGCVRLQ